MKIKSIVILGLTGILSVILIVFAADRHDDNNHVVPVIQTIITEKNIFNDDNMWDDNSPSPKKSNAAANAESEIIIEFPIDLNTADINTLVYIKGIGESTAEKIIAYRNENGLFKSVNELCNIDGIGEKSVEKWSGFLFVDVVNVTADTETQLVETSETTAIENINNGLINLNSASVDELMTLNGIGEATAKKIYDYAHDTGFKSVDELINVNGIGEKKLENIRPFVYVGD